MLLNSNNKLSPEQSTYNQLLNDPKFVEWVRFGKSTYDQYWVKWLSDKPNELIPFEEAKAFLTDLPAEEQFPEIDIKAEARKIIQNALNIEEFKKQDNKKQLFFERRWVKGFQMAASIIVLLGITSLLFYAILNRQEWINKDAKLISESNTKTKPASIFLSDSSIIKLNVKSSLEYPKAFGKSKYRQVSLIGEAFFDVKSNEEHPFIVKTKDVDIMVLGTEFNVKNYKEDDNVEVTVVEGFVIVSGMNKGTGENVRFPLRPNEKLVFNKINRSWIVEKVNSTNAILWKEGVLNFNYMQLSEIINNIERWYNVEIVLENTIDSKTYFSGKFNNNDLNSILDGLCFSLKCHYKYAGDKKIIFY